MNPFEVKVFLMKNGLTIASISRELCRDSDTKPASMATMISDMIYGRRFYPKLARKLDKKFGLKFERPAQFESAAEIIKQAA
ncbi:MAG: hypothetical protein ACR2LT_09100 [Pyrinomonadaceae bacterium]